ncbi:glycoside hydrolase family 20 protein [Marinilabilia salmonicolor]|uniref:glycoside hydrolase family 20 protein n=1 Tax=Marinilabilia salmonicolor TaxID=989 RepID=UPI00029A7B95|nr:glycoside hydrolase family 20 protein [Marinilabilia salmonicolor]
MIKKSILKTLALGFLSILSGISNAQNTADYRVVPLPMEIIQNQESPFELTRETKIVTGDDSQIMRRNAGFLQQYIKQQTGIETIIATKGGSSRIVLQTGLKSDSPEAYEINVSGDVITLTGASETGVFYGIQTLRKSLPVKKSSSISFPSAVIKDTPRFSYRGMMLDVARHMFSVKEIKTFIDMLALHNINRFHWHLTEDQGWRIEIKKYPRLTEVGSMRKETVIGRNSGRYDGEPYGGFYTQDEIKEIVKYAADQHITIIPEIDMPGHMLAALSAYPELGCTGGPYEVWTQWGVSEDVLCVGKDKTLKFVENVLNEVMDLFPSEMIHIGGDECPKSRWEECPTCQAKIKELGLKADDHHSAEERLQSHFISQVEKIINDRGRKLIGWDEILEGGLAPNATVMSWRGMSGGIEAAKQGHDVVMTPNSHVYFDHYQSTDVARDPLAIGGYSPVERVYSLEPVPSVLSKKQRKHILGAQANLWTEYIPVFEHAQFMVLPRMAALSEVQWMEPENRNYEDFLQRLLKLIEIYKINDYNYAKHIFDLNAEFAPNAKDNTIDVFLSSLTEGDIYYTLNGTAPVKHSPKYKGVIKVDKDAIVMARTYFNGESSRVFSESISFNLATTKPIKSLQPIDKQYGYDGISTLVDGLNGNNNYRTGRWIAFRGNDLEAVIELGSEPVTIREAALTTNVVKGDWIFDVRQFKVLVSDDGESFRTLASRDYDPLQKNDSDGIKNHVLRFDPVKARYVKIIGKSEKSMPEWHGGAGMPGYLFVDEIVIK